MTRVQKEFFISAYEEYKRLFDIEKERKSDKYQKLRNEIRSKKDGRS